MHDPCSGRDAAPVAQLGSTRAARLALGAVLLGLIGFTLGACGSDGGGNETPACPVGTDGCPCNAGGGCGGTLECLDGVCGTPECPAGTLGCPCFGNGTCNSGLECTDAACVASSCPVGTAGCPCDTGDTCTGNLVCEAGTCAPPPVCEEGTVGCPCFGNGTCIGDLVCEAGTCMAPPECAEGTLGCPCVGGTACLGELVCAEGTCAEPPTPCPAGTEGCPCFENDTCGWKNGTQLVCTNAVCVVPTCPAGSVGCPCKSDGTCDGELGCQGSGPAATCEVVVECPAGSEGCPCAAGNTCGDGLYCDGGNCAPLLCTPGTLACLCEADACTEVGVACGADGWCHAVECPGGQEGCLCTADGRCGYNARGEALTCSAGLCTAPSCAPGATGCVCIQGTDCTAAADGCRDGFCHPAGCIPGELNCTCAGGGCHPGLTCRDGAICVDNSGYLGGPCLLEGACFRGGRCQNETCVPCTVGTIGCACTAGGSCFSGGLCRAELCVDASTVEQPPDAPLCYTPCEQDLVTDAGAYRPCPADGLMAGCVGDLTCTDGSCVPPGQPAPVCEGDIDCPVFQTCIAGHCYSDCTIDADCPSDRVCHLHVCRLACMATVTDPCPPQWACESDDGTNGVCLPLRAPGSLTQYQVQSGYRVNKLDLTFTNANTAATLILTNDGPTFEEFTVRKRSHRAYLADGGVQANDDPAGDGVDCNPMVDCPLVWMRIGEAGAAAPVQQFTVGVEGNGGKATIVFENAGGGTAPRWDGELEIRHATLGNRLISANYTERPEGRWTGKIYYFANFNDRELGPWRATAESRDNPALIARVGNAFVQRWGAFRTGNISWEELLAVLTATQSESWRTAAVQSDCPAANGACYPYDINTLGLVVYTSNRSSTPVPSGVTELPLSLNLRLAGTEAEPGLMEGRVESSLALQYPGNPAVRLDFGSDPAICERNTGGACLVFLDGFEADIYLGGRFESDAADTDCAARANAGYESVRIPWLVPGFVRGTEIDAASGLRYRYECRDTRLPFSTGADEDIPEDLMAANRALTASNPIPDGRTRRRSIRLVDGALVNQSQLFVIFEETFDSYLPGDVEPFSAYGYLVLSREPADLAEADDNDNDIADVYEGSVPSDERPEPDDLLDVQCAPELVEEILGPGNDEVTGDNAADLVLALIDGVLPGSGGSFITAESDEQVHYLCADTGLIDGGSGAVTDPWRTIPNNDSCGMSEPSDNHYDDNGHCDDGGPDADTSICPIGTDRTDCGDRHAADGDFRVACPAGSDVTYFTVDDDEISQEDIADLPCQDDGSCEDTLNDWIAADEPLIQVDPAWRCSDPDQVYCDADRYDLRQGKRFYAYTAEEAVFPPLYAEVDLAFRYKTRFRSRTGDSPGFAPQICLPGSNQIPYCYDPPAIERIRGRVDCLLAIWRNHYDDVAETADIGTTAKGRLDEYLCTNYAYAEACHQGLESETPHDGFERLYAELLVMMGDESYTQAFASRFDLAGQSAVSFEGTLFEEGGLDLSGAAGYEMYTLYRAAQYYQEALDRFYRQSPLMWEALGYEFDPQNFVTPETVTWYFERLIRASTQKSRAWSEIGKRYQNFNRPELARAVVERAYTATYVEGILLSQLMLRIVDVLRPEDRPQIIRVLEDGQRRYRTALLDMQNVHDDIDDNVNYFGLEPDYIPFPALNPLEYNAFEVLLGRARQKVEVARYREDQAINRSTAFETDAEEFQAELVRLRNNYEGRLGDICGTFEAVDGRIYPAITRYAHLHPRAKFFGDPCGLVGNGQVYDSMAQFEQAQLDMQRVKVSTDNVLAEVEIERSRVSAQCDLIVSLADFVYDKQGEMNDLQRDINNLRMVQSSIERTLSVMSTLAQLAKCSVGTSTDCPMAAAAFSWYGLVTIGLNAAAVVTEGFIHSKEQDIADINRNLARWQTLSQCEAATIDSNARVASILLRIKELELDSLRTSYQVRLALSHIQGLLNQAKRIEMEMDEAEQLSINVAAARNDPNVRIYRNDAIVNADLAFEDAIREVYRATRVLEYYTSTSYAEREKLFLVRMVQYGDYNLETYLTDIENEYYAFEEVYGLPDLRVAVISLRDDILAIPRLGDEGQALSQSDRIDRMRAKLLDASLLDENGYLTVPFSTDFDRLSPLTRNHKVHYMEAEVIGSDVGDTVGRVYVRQRGTSVVHGLLGDRQYFRFPERTAVLNPFFNGNRIFNPEVYKSDRLRDRPFVNTSWQLVVNQRDERANQDLNLQSLTDIRLYVYYDDFTAL